MQDLRYTDWGGLLAVWGPRILGAIAILVVAWFVAKLVKGALARGVDRFPALKHHNEGRDPNSTAGSRLGEVAYWLVLLIGVVAALNVLNLGGVVTPLNAMLTTFFAYVPNIVGALLIFFIGFIVATLAKRLVTAGLQAAGVDKLAQRMGGSPSTGSSLASGLGTVVFVLILIPVAIAALETLQIAAISGPAIAVLTMILNALPLVLAAAIVLALGYAIGRWAAGVVEKVLPATGFDRAVQSLAGRSPTVRQARAAAPGGPAPHGDPARFAPDGEPRNAPYQGQSMEASAYEATGEGFGDPVTRERGSGDAAEFARKAAPPPPNTPSRVVAQIVLWAIVIFSAIEAARLLQFGAMAAIFTEILGLFGRVLFGAVIITAGVLIADFLASAVGRSAGAGSRFAATLVRWAVIALATAMGLSFMGIADEIVMLAFGLILGSAAVAAALAFGLGGREAAGRLMSRAVDKAEREMTGPPSPLDPTRGGPPPRGYAGGPDERFQ